MSRPERVTAGSRPAAVGRGAVIDAFAGFPATLANAARRTARHPVAAGEWGPAEIVRHLLAVEHEVWQARLAQVAAEDDPHWSWTEPGQAAGFDGPAVDPILAAFAAARATNVATVWALDDAGWARAGTHAAYGRLDVEGLLRLAIDHDAEHLRALGG